MTDRLRRLGYRIRSGAPSPVIGMLQRAGVRPRPLNRSHPNRSTYISACPWCEAEDTLYVEPDGVTWMTTCGCSPGGGILELHARLLLQAIAA